MYGTPEKMVKWFTDHTHHKQWRKTTYKLGMNYSCDKIRIFRCTNRAVCVVKFPKSASEEITFFKFFTAEYFIKELDDGKRK